MEKLKQFIKDNFLIILAAIYVLLPIDLIPEIFIPVVGFLDDLGIAGFALIKKAYDVKKSKNV